jgi:hypothetical protein
MKLLSGKNVRKSGRPPKSILPEEEKGDEEVVVAI